MPQINPPDIQARKRALDVERSFLVRAPAGSGKTELLIQRYLALLARVEAPEAIVAITFTRKAAAEMSDRVLKKLRNPDGELAQAALEQNRRREWHLLENPSRMAIQTIDSLCTSIAGRMPWTARLGDMPDIAENAGALYAEAARETLRMVTGDGPEADAVATLLSHLDNRAEKVAQLIAAMLGRREQWMEDVVRAQERSGSRAREYLEESSASARLRMHAKARPACSPNTGRPKRRSSPSSRRFHRPSRKIFRDWLVLIGLLLTKESEWRKGLDARQGVSAGTAEDPTPRSGRRASRK